MISLKKQSRKPTTINAAIAACMVMAACSPPHHTVTPMTKTIRCEYVVNDIGAASYQHVYVYYAPDGSEVGRSAGMGSCDPNLTLKHPAHS
jgi:hypothetical protein